LLQVTTAWDVNLFTDHETGVPAAVGAVEAALPT
jgi:hypothetical protein